MASGNFGLPENLSNYVFTFSSKESNDIGYSPHTGSGDKTQNLYDSCNNMVDFVKDILEKEPQARVSKEGIQHLKEFTDAVSKELPEEATSINKVIDGLETFMKLRQEVDKISKEKSTPDEKITKLYHLSVNNPHASFDPAFQNELRLNMHQAES